MSYRFDQRRAWNQTPGRDGRSLDRIIIHHWGRDGQTHDGIVGFFADGPGLETSAHYVVSGGRVTNLVAHENTAWHAGVWDINCRSIGIECRPEMSPEDFATVCELVGSLKVTFGNLAIYGHRDVVGTACPGRYYGRLGELRAIPAGWQPGNPAPAPVPGGAIPLPAWTLPEGHFYGLITGGEDSHGGYYEAERPAVRAIQQWLIRHGYVPGVTDVNSPWADGIYEQPTADAVTRFQKAERKDSTDRWGEVWADDLATMAANNS